MKNLTLALWLILAVGCTQSDSSSPEPQTIITLKEIPFTAGDIINPMRGFYDWQGYGARPPGLNYPEFYKRYMWDQIETSKGVYDFSVIRNDMVLAKSKKQKFAFRIMAVNSFHSDAIGVPEDLLDEVPGDYCSYSDDYIKSSDELDRVWVPDWNSPAFINRAKALVTALGQAFDGDPVMAYYDMGIYGHWGEWHAYPFTNCTTAGEASETTKRNIVDMQLAAFNKTRIVMNSGADNSAAFAYAMNKSNRIGVRIDSFNWPWFDQQIEQNPTKKALVESRWKTAPIIVEFGGNFSPEDSKDFSLAQAQVKRWHIASVANGNAYNWETLTQSQKDNFLTIGKLAGFRIVPREFRYAGAVSRGSSFRLTSIWCNVGVTPLYEPFVIRYELRLKGQNSISWWGNSTFDLQALLPTIDTQGKDTPKKTTDTFTIPSRLSPGTYTLSMVVYDPTGYRDKLALAIEGRSKTGRYVLGDVTIR
jgi:hypothetical protein